MSNNFFSLKLDWLLIESISVGHDKYSNSKNQIEFGSNSIVKFSFLLSFILSKLQLQTTIKPWKDKK